MTRRGWLWVSGVATGVMIIALAVPEARMKATGGEGIVCFELAGSDARAAEIMAEWGGPGQDAARLSLSLDFPFLVAYGAFLTLAVRAVRGRVRPRYAAVGKVVVWLPAAAAACDVVEDVLLLGVLDGSGDPAAARGFALVKFAALVVALLYLAGAWFARRR